MFLHCVFIWQRFNHNPKSNPEKKPNRFHAAIVYIVYMDFKKDITILKMYASVGNFIILLIAVDNFRSLNHGQEIYIIT